MTQQRRRLKRTRGTLAAILSLIALTGSSAAQELTGRFETIDVPGATVTQVRGVTADGRLVGFDHSGTGVVHGFLLAGRIVASNDVRFAGSPSRTSAQGISGRGEIVGIWVRSGVGARGYLLEAYGGFSELEVPGAVNTRPRGINASGDIVGWFAASGLMRGFIRDRAGEYQSIAIPGAIHTHACSINDRGNIVGKYFIGPATAFNAYDAFALTITCVVAINARGEIAGNYVDANGVAHGFVLHQPE